ncbi:MAG: dCTP deaminase [Nitrososphaerota archaeon]|jgi:dCTP deaminase|nr:dCTP deaminase [Nitrososphaerota archaeon]
MILSDYDLHNAIAHHRIVIKPFSRHTIRENGVDFRLSDQIARHNKFKKGFVLDPTNERHVRDTYQLSKGVKTLVIGSNEQVLLSTHEYMEMPDDVMGFVELRSTWARHGISMPPTIIDAGFKGNVTLEVINNAPYSIALMPKQRFAHIIFVKTNSKVEKVYSGKYQGQVGVRLPKLIQRS